MRLAGHAPKVGHNELDLSGVCEWDRNFQRCYRYVLLNNLVLAVPKIGQMPECGTFPDSGVVLLNESKHCDSGWCSTRRSVFSKLGYSILLGMSVLSRCSKNIGRIVTYV